MRNVNLFRKLPNNVSEQVMQYFKDKGPLVDQVLFDHIQVTEGQDQDDDFTE